MDTIKPTPKLVIYPESDGQPMTESDATRTYLIYAVEVLQLYFQSQRNVYVSGNLFIYYEEGNNQAVFSPDVFVIFGVSSSKRRTYKTWQEGGKLPAFILEITSKTTRKQDEREKPELYASLGIQEYFQYDPTRDYLNPQLKGSRLVNGQYQPLPLQQTAHGTPFISSQTLGLDLQLHPPRADFDVFSLPLELRFYDPRTGSKLLNRQEVEQSLALTQQERDLAQQERDLAQQERDLAQQRIQQLEEQLRQLGINPEQNS